MKNRLLTSTAMGALLVTSGYAYSEGMGLRFFGGLNFLDDGTFAITSGGSTTLTGVVVATTGVFHGSGPHTHADFGSIHTAFSQNAAIDNDNGYVFGGAVNYQWDNGLILEVEAAYRRNKFKLGGSGFFSRNTTKTLTSVYHTVGSSATFQASGPFSASTTKGSAALNTVSGNGHISAVSLMANAWYEFDLGNSQWKPYVGGGVGMAWIDIEAQGKLAGTFFTTLGYLARPGTPTTTGTFSTAVALHGTESGFAWQLGAGIGFEFAPGKQITLDYRYFNGPKLGDVDLVVGGSATKVDIDYDYDAHNVMLGFKIGL